MDKRRWQSGGCQHRVWYSVDRHSATRPRRPTADRGWTLARREALSRTAWRRLDIGLLETGGDAAWTADRRLSATTEYAGWTARCPAYSPAAICPVMYRQLMSRTYCTDCRCSNHVRAGSMFLNSIIGAPTLMLKLCGDSPPSVSELRHCRVDGLVVESLFCFDINKLQCVQNCLPRVVRQDSCNSATSLLSELHWLPVSKQLNFKIATLAY